MRRLALAGGCLAAAGCASLQSAQTAPGQASPTRTATADLDLRPADTADAYDDGSVYGLFLAGETALDQGESRDAAFYLGRASARDPSAPFIKERAFAAALVSGQVDRAAALAPAEPAVADKGSAPPTQAALRDDAAYVLGLLARASVALADGRGHEAYALLKSAPPDDHSVAVVLLTPWAAAAAGDQAAATAPVAPRKDRALEAFAALGHGLLLDHYGQTAAADAVLKDEATRGGVFALAYGGFLERHGRRAEAEALYDKALARDPVDPAFRAAKARVDAGRPAPSAPSLRAGAAQALMEPAALLLAAKQADAGLAYLRLALKLDPSLDEAWVLVGDAMDAASDGSAAREAYAHVQPGSPEYATAQGRLALSLQTAGDKDAALKLARATADAHPDDPQSLVVLADILRDDERYDEAVQVLDRLIGEVGGDTAAKWRLYYLRGASLERAGRWASAQADLQHALQQKPDDPEVLNYLGFAWADRGEHLQQALGLLEKATALDPQDGAIIDSLGWAHYRLGDYPQAVKELELAVSLDPADPEVNAHLGDAYWRTGRRLEAGFQWRRVLTLDPDRALRASVETRLTGGLQRGTRAPERAEAVPARP